MIEAGVIQIDEEAGSAAAGGSKVAMVFGQVGDPPY